MKIPMYVDVFKGQREFFSASSNPYGKPEGTKRYRFLIEIPDPLEVDGEAPVLESGEVKEAV